MLACPPAHYKNPEDTMNNNDNVNTAATAEAPVSNGPKPAENLPNGIPVTLEPRKWLVDWTRNNKTNKVSRVFVTDMTGGLTEALCLGDWAWNWSTVDSPMMSLQANTEYVITFWLNGGETEIEQETCQFRVYLNGDGENPLIYPLNRDVIKPLKYHKGWYRFAIPFNTGESYNDTVRVMLQFVAMRAYCAILPDKPEYADLPDEERPDPRIPQRHNIAHGASGYPRDKSWSYLVFGNEATDPANTGGSSGRNSGNTKKRSGALEQFVNAGVDIEGLLEHMDSYNLMELLREDGAIERLSNLGVDIDGLLEHMDDDDKIELLRDMM